jgi:hypothetical protein
MIDDQVDAEEIAESRKRREIGAMSPDASASVAPKQEATAIDVDANVPQQPWGKRVWAWLGAWGVRTHVRHPRPE